MRHCLSVCVLAMIITKAQPDSIEDHHSYTYSYNPTALNFNDIYSVSLHNPGAPAEEKKYGEEYNYQYTTTDNYILNNVESQFVEFHPEVVIRSTTVPPPRYILNSTFLKMSPKPVVTSTTTEEDEFIKVVPIKKNYQRGVLDLLFPETRVRTFKSIFNTIRRMLSHTFRR